MPDSILSLAVPYQVKQPEIILEYLCLECITSRWHQPQLSYCNNHVAVSDYYTTIIRKPTSVAWLRFFLSQQKWIKKMLLIGIEQEINQMIVAQADYIETGIWSLVNNMSDIINVLTENHIPYVYSNQNKDFINIQLCLGFIKLYSDISSVCMMIISQSMVNQIYCIIQEMPKDMCCLIQAPHDVHFQICNNLP